MLRAISADLTSHADIYGTSSEVKAEPSIYESAISTKSIGDGSLILNLCDVVSAYGGIRSLTVGLIGDDVLPSITHSCLRLMIS